MFLITVNKNDFSLELFLVVRKNKYIILNSFLIVHFSPNRNVKILLMESACGCFNLCFIFKRYINFYLIFYCLTLTSLKQK